MAFEPMFADILGKLREYDPNKIYSPDELIAVLLAITDPEFNKAMIELRNAMDAVATSA